MKTTSQQREILLAYLISNQRITTLQARSELDIMHPGGRICELRQLGHEIVTHWRVVDTGTDSHRIAEYVYFGSSSHE